jgi:hypothetical protein
VLRYKSFRAADIQMGGHSTDIMGLNQSEIYRTWTAHFRSMIRLKVVLSIFASNLSQGLT